MDPPASVRKPAEALRIFLIEDSQAVRERLSELLTVPGEFEVIGSADGEKESVDKLRRDRVDVAIVDLNLAQGSGFGVIASMRALYPHPPPTIVVLTNYAFPEYEAACRARGADYFFDKTQFGAVRRLLADLRAGGHPS